jgi:23S rRNA pseudouridine2605 synthase
MMSKKPFEKFINKTSTGAKKKEEIRQQKKKVKAEVRALEDEVRKKNADKYKVVTNKDRQVVNKPGANQSNLKRAEHKPAKEAPRYKQGKAVKQTYEQIAIKKEQSSNEQMPLNKYVAHAGICGRREAAELVKEGVVTVNGDVIYEPGYKVNETDKVTVKGKSIFLQQNLVYILINKPKDYLTTVKDPEGRKTVFDLIAGATKERVYPVGRLDRNTTGVLLLTNDGELAQKLTHPSFEIKKLYEVKLDKPVTKKDMESLLSGITLEDGFVKADSIAYADSKDKSIVGIEIHSGRNRIVRRLFEHLGYKVKNLDRVMFANLTKKNVDRGKWRYLNEKEVRLLKFMNQSFIKKVKDVSNVK